MSITDPQLVNIEIATIPNRGISGLQLTYQDQRYDLIQAFSDRKLDTARQQWQQLMSLNNSCENSAARDRYLLVREVGYYSLWALDRSQPMLSLPAVKPTDDRGVLGLAWQQATIWLFQELWFQWQDLLGATQLQVFAENLIVQTPHFQSRADLDRLLELDSLATTRLTAWTELDFRTFALQVYHLTQKKLGQQFGTQIASEIIQSMPELLRSTLLDALGI
jgi:hypothetical protein